MTTTFDEIKKILDQNNDMKKALAVCKKALEAFSIVMEETNHHNKESILPLIELTQTCINVALRNYD